MKLRLGINSDFTTRFQFTSLQFNLISIHIRYSTLEIFNVLVFHNWWVTTQCKFTPVQ